MCCNNNKRTSEVDVERAGRIDMCGGVCVVVQRAFALNRFRFQPVMSWMNYFKFIANQFVIIAQNEKIYR